MFKKENGITLVALVVTIIVLLILAGVTISMVSGDDGIATKASTAKTETDIGNAQDAIGLVISDAKLEYYEDFANGVADPEIINTGTTLNAKLVNHSFELKALSGDDAVTLEDVLETGDKLKIQATNVENPKQYTVTFVVGTNGLISGATVSEE